MRWYRPPAAPMATVETLSGRAGMRKNDTERAAGIRFAGVAGARLLPSPQLRARRQRNEPRLKRGGRIVGAARGVAILIPADDRIGSGDRTMAVTFDTLKAATRLREEAGFSEKQATELVATFADGFVENLATKDDVEHLRADVEKLEVSLRGDIDHLRGDMGKMALRTDLEKTGAQMVGEMSKVAHRLTVRLGGAIAAGVGILVAVDKLF